MTFWEFCSNVATAFINRFNERAFFGLLIIGSFILVMGTLAHFPLPGEVPGEKNAEYFGQGFVALIGAIGIIVGAIWKTSPSERTDRETINTLVNKQPPVTGEARESAKETDHDRSSHATATSVACPVCGAYRPGHTAADHPVESIPDNIPGL